MGEQVELFRNVRLIIGAHGAGLSNIVFASPNTTACIELPSVEEHLQYYFSHIAAALDMYYWVLPSVSTTYFRHFENSPQFVSDILQVTSDAMSFLNTL